MKKAYTHFPIDTQGIIIPEELCQIVEGMAKNVHEEWAERRISQGWTYGEKRDDTLKTHPCLVPYEELPEEEKEYDRNTCIATIEFLLKLGYKITK